MHKIPLSRVCILVGFLVLADVCQGKDPWEAIDECLSKKEISLEPENGMLAVLDMLESLKKSWLPSSSEKATIKALKRFKQLNNMANLPVCDEEAREWRLEFVNLTPIKNSVRLSAIVNHYAKKHARNCQAYYADRYARVPIRNDPKLELVHMFLLEHIATVMTGDNRRYGRADASVLRSELLVMIGDGPLRAKLIDRFIMHQEPIANEVTAQNAYYLLEFYVKNTMRRDEAANNLVNLVKGIDITDPEKIGKLLEDLIFEFCEKHSQLNFKYFKVARADLEQFEWQDIVDLEGRNLDSFYIDWAELNVCERIVSETQERDELVELTKKVADEALASARQSVKWL